jgi:2,4-dienoyl-CoA reductase-like NADH-dependent reductase (Old Yellow Enzyme family)
MEVTQAVVDAIGADRTGIRLSPFQKYLDASDSTPYSTHTLLVERLNPLGLAYIHMVEPRVQGAENVNSWTESVLPFRTVCKVPFIVAGG